MFMKPGLLSKPARSIPPRPAADYQQNQNRSVNRSATDQTPPPPSLIHSHRARRLHLLLSDLHVGLVGVVIRVELQSLPVVADSLGVFVEAGQG